MNYALQACINLESVFAARGDKEAVRHFKKRQAEILRKANRKTK